MNYLMTEKQFITVKIFTIDDYKKLILMNIKK